jgi:hypothetical protein
MEGEPVLLLLLLVFLVFLFLVFTFLHVLLVMLCLVVHENLPVTWSGNNVVLNFARGSQVSQLAPKHTPSGASNALSRLAKAMETVRENLATFRRPTRTPWRN